MLVPAMRWKPIVLWSLAAGLLIDAVVVFVALSSKTWRQIRLENKMLGFGRGYGQETTAQGVANARKWWAEWHDLMGPDDRWTLNARSSYAAALLDDHQQREWETEMRELIKLGSRLFGPRDIQVVENHYRLASGLDEMGRYAEAELEWRICLTSYTDENGTVQSFGMNCLRALQVNLDRQGKYEDEIQILHLDLERVAPLASEQRSRPRGLMENDYQGEEQRLQQTLKHVEAKALAKRDYETVLYKLGAEHDDTKQLKTRLEELKKTKL
ncbi:hypothetical protein [Prosthecobacter sp.]|uniref:hypothetical protein n=1 Tax=Prosthecobacter sp. TaxID=1965333 RepID=UPI002ABC7ADE|nr:hypothetical protein [Prosthecobacter sp.]MDZ4405153.1 hypothetical protein [Prosthecobacter sp.]